ncbi:MAG TPA: hypothetical protein VFV67_08345 [Actinophytocola sp.]|uniref:hypothetical protein n=1 Tax=Actinophytocola sp. TaxID=1872138 RepID=UPI002DB93063|nr:hypothetical protein [Actinophytocola sp.]HEU5470649.1 hypothetical protein [Actinophytocola sp.]
MREVLPWVQHNLGVSPWVVAVVLLVSAAGGLVTVIGKFLAIWTAVRSADPARRDSACRVLELLIRSRFARLSGRSGKNS